jgi:hypothetical protein
MVGSSEGFALSLDDEEVGLEEEEGLERDEEDDGDFLGSEEEDVSAASADRRA